LPHIGVVIAGGVSGAIINAFSQRVLHSGSLRAPQNFSHCSVLLRRRYYRNNSRRFVAAVSDGSRQINDDPPSYSLMSLRMTNRITAPMKFEQKDDAGDDNHRVHTFTHTWNRKLKPDGALFNICKFAFQKRNLLGPGVTL
jgi:hypothetical protein